MNEKMIVNIELLISMNMGAFCVIVVDTWGLKERFVNYNFNQCNLASLFKYLHKTITLPEIDYTE